MVTTTTTLEAAPAAALLEAAEGADLLVVGSRDLGPFSGLLLGSVSHRCVLHAPCSVGPSSTDRHRARPGQLGPGTGPRGQPTGVGRSRVMVPTWV